MSPPVRVLEGFGQPAATARLGVAPGRVTNITSHRPFLGPKRPLKVFEHIGETVAGVRYVLLCFRTGGAARRCAEALKGEAVPSKRGHESAGALPVTGAMATRKPVRRIAILTA